MKAASQSISVWITCFAALVSVLGAADIASAYASYAGFSYRAEVSATENVDTDLALAIPSHGAGNSPTVHHIAPLLLDTSAEYELDESDQSDNKDLFSPPARNFANRARLARLMRAHLLRAVARTSESPDSRGPPHA